MMPMMINNLSMLHYDDMTMKLRFGGGMLDKERFEKFFLDPYPGKIYKDYNYDRNPCGNLISIAP